MVTGANEFFLVNKDVVDAFDLSEFTHPMFGRSQHCQGVIYDEVQHLANIENKLPVYFLYFDKEFHELPKKRKNTFSMVNYRAFTSDISAEFENLGIRFPLYLAQN